MVEASGEDDPGDAGDNEDKEIEPPPLTRCPAHKPVIKLPKGVMTDTEVFDNCVGFLIGANETTGLLLSFVSYLLALHPDIQEELQSRIDEYFEDKPVRQIPSIPDQQFIYLVSSEIGWFNLNLCIYHTYPSWKSRSTTRHTPY